MKAILIREHGGVDKLEWADVPAPTLTPGAAVVSVRAVALNHLDLWVRRGVPGHKFPLPIIPGCEVAGVIEDVGAGGAEWRARAEGVVAPAFSFVHFIPRLSRHDPL